MSRELEDSFVEDLRHEAEANRRLKAPGRSLRPAAADCSVHETSLALVVLSEHLHLRAEPWTLGQPTLLDKMCSVKQCLFIDQYACKK